MADNTADSVQIGTLSDLAQFGKTPFHSDWANKALEEVRKINWISDLQHDKAKIVDGPYVRMVELEASQYGGSIPKSELLTGELIFQDNSSKNAKYESGFEAVEGIIADAQDKTHVSIYTDSIVVAEKGSHVQLGLQSCIKSLVVAKSGSFVDGTSASHGCGTPTVSIIAEKGANVLVDNHDQVKAAGGANVFVESDQIPGIFHFKTMPGTVTEVGDNLKQLYMFGSPHSVEMVEAVKGSTVIANDHAKIIAEDGSHVIANKGSQIFAEPGATVDARSGSHLIVKAGARVHSESGADISADPSPFLGAGFDAEIDSIADKVPHYTIYKDVLTPVDEPASKPLKLFTAPAGSNVTCERDLFCVAEAGSHVVGAPESEVLAQSGSEVTMKGKIGDENYVTALAGSHVTLGEGTFLKAYRGAHVHDTDGTDGTDLYSTNKGLQHRNWVKATPGVDIKYDRSWISRQLENWGLTTPPR